MTTLTAPSAVHAKPLLGRLRTIARGFRAFGIDSGEPCRAEERDTLHLEKELSASAVAKLRLPRLRALARSGGTALDLSFQAGGIILLQVSASTTDQDLINLGKSARAVGSVTLVLHLDKPTLLAEMKVGAPFTEPFLFLHAAALARALAVSPQTLETPGHLFENATGERKMVILVADRDLSLDGHWLAVAGGCHLASWRCYCPATAPDPLPLRAFHARALDPRTWLSWSGFSLEHLTPHQLAVAWTGAAAAPAGDPVIAALARKRLELVLAHLANQTRETPAVHPQWKWLCTFQGERSSGSIQLGTPPEPALAGLPDAPAAVGILGDLAVWAYAAEDPDSDRLRILRNLLADVLSDGRPESNTRLLLEAARHLQRDAQGSWDSFVHGKLKEYFARVQQLEEMLEDTVQSVQNQLQTLIKGVSDSMLGAVGVIVGSFIAALFGQGFNAEVFRLGVFLYAVYLALFPGLIGLLSIHQQGRETRERFTLRTQGFANRLSERVVQEIVGQKQSVDRTIERFRRWFMVAVGIYAVTVIALILGAWKIPALV